MSMQQWTVDEVLKRSDLSGCDLSGLSLGATNLRGKNLRGADLSNAHLGGADLTGADLRNANLNRANLGAAILIGADLRLADLREANLQGARLDGADLREAMGLQGESGGSIDYLIKPVNLEVTEDFNHARDEGYFPLAHWGDEYTLVGGNTLSKSDTVWIQFKKQLGDSIFGDRKIFSEVRLVQQYKQYSQWAYMISKKGFLRMARSLGLKIRKKPARARA